MSFIPSTFLSMSEIQRQGWQPSFDDLGRALAETTFVVVDLETTGGSHSQSSITEIGAVKIRGGEIIGEFQTLVNPESPIPAFITVLTGITDAMVVEAPTIGSALFSFLEFAGSPSETVLIAHNAPFDIGFLKSAAAQCSTPWPNYQVLDTARIARYVVTRDEAPNCKLSTWQLSSERPLILIIAPSLMLAPQSMSFMEFLIDLVPSASQRLKISSPSQIE